MLGNDKARKGGNSWKNNSQESSLEGRKEGERKRGKERLKGLRPVFPPSLFLTGTERMRMYVWEKFRFLPFFFYFRSRACKRRVEGKAFLCLCLPLDVPKQLFVSLLPLFQFFMVHVVTDGRTDRTKQRNEGGGRRRCSYARNNLVFPRTGEGGRRKGRKNRGRYFALTSLRGPPPLLRPSLPLLPRYSCNVAKLWIGKRARKK